MPAFRYAMGWLPDYPDFRDYTTEHAEIKPLLKKIGLPDILMIIGVSQPPGRSDDTRHQVVLPPVLRIHGDGHVVPLLPQGPHKFQGLPWRMTEKIPEVYVVHQWIEPENLRRRFQRRQDVDDGVGIPGPQEAQHRRVHKGVADPKGTLDKDFHAFDILD